MENKHRVDGDMSLVKRTTAAPVPVENICPSIYIDKKRIASSVCAELVERKMLAGNKARIIEPDRSEEYSGFVSIHQVISPVLMVIKLAAWPAMAKSRKTDLENALAKHWVAKKKSFDMVNDFPGKWMHVLVSVCETEMGTGGTEELVIADDESEREGNLDEGLPPGSIIQLGDVKNLEDYEDVLNRGVESMSEKLYRCDNQPPGRSPFLPRKRGLYRGVIVDLTPGIDVLCTTYKVFLYDEAKFCECHVNELGPLPDDCRTIADPLYRLLKIPGLQPLVITEKLTDLFLRQRTTFYMPGSSWSETVLEKARLQLNSAKTLMLDVCADQGIQIYGDINFATDDNHEESYRKFLLDNKLAYRNDGLFYDELCLDAEDEELGDWMLEARTWC